MKKICLLGSTGSIGTQCLDVCSGHPEEYRVTCLACGTNIEKLEQQILDHRPEVVVVRREEDARKLAEDHPDVDVSYGEQAYREAAAQDCDLVVNAMSGIAGLAPTYAALSAGNDVALANKETLVAGGGIIMDTARDHGARIFPVDSEHCAIFQCLEGRDKSEVDKLILTGSGGPFRNYSYEAMERVTLEQALHHPNWEMGPKITVDSATMMNKGLEFIEAMWLFDQSPDNIRIVIHPQSIVHSMVQFCDGSVIAQMGPVDMRIPIALALSWPRRLENGFEKLDFEHRLNLTFDRPDFEKFRCLKLALETARMGGSYPIVLNAANEVLVSLFLSGRLMFNQISRNLEDVVARHRGESFHDIEEILAIDREAREETMAVAGVAK
ncbi:MAG: 1-deoxy-D-xylulose-5-phosphate reductoisomerase [Eubacteriales bacterium]|nr:1-deoxy-D-xylulose-5-phosphate reductoisomerase [Eubacteriales bacterium]